MQRWGLLFFNLNCSFAFFRRAHRFTTKDTKITKKNSEISACSAISAVKKEPDPEIGESTEPKLQVRPPEIVAHSQQMVGTMSDYDREVKQIRSYNKPILDEFQLWLGKNGLAPNTVKSHLENIDFFVEYLTYDEPLGRLDEADDSDVYGFLMDWYPRKAMWASEAYTKAYMASFRKFFKYLRESNRIEQTVEDEVRETLKENKEEFLDAVASDGTEFDW